MHAHTHAHAITLVERVCVKFEKGPKVSHSLSRLRVLTKLHPRTDRPGYAQANFIVASLRTNVGKGRESFFFLRYLLLNARETRNVAIAPAMIKATEVLGDFLLEASPSP